MNNILEQTDKLISTLDNSSLIKSIKSSKDKEYLSNLNTLNLHIYYLNKEINKLIQNRSCGKLWE